MNDETETMQPTVHLRGVRWIDKSHGLQLQQKWVDEHGGFEWRPLPIVEMKSDQQPPHKPWLLRFPWV